MTGQKPHDDDAEPTAPIDMEDFATTRVADDLQATSVRATPADLEATQVRGSPEDFEATRLQEAPSLAGGTTVRMGSEHLADVHAAVDRALDKTDEVEAPFSKPTSILPLHLQPTPPASTPISAPPLSPQPTSQSPVSAPAFSGPPSSAAPPSSFVPATPPSRAPVIAAIVGVVLLSILAAVAIAVLTRG